MPQATLQTVLGEFEVLEQHDLPGSQSLLVVRQRSAPWREHLREPLAWCVMLRAAATDAEERWWVVVMSEKAIMDLCDGRVSVRDALSGDWLKTWRLVKTGGREVAENGMDICIPEGDLPPEDVYLRAAAPPSRRGLWPI